MDLAKELEDLKTSLSKSLSDEATKELGLKIAEFEQKANGKFEQEVKALKEELTKSVEKLQEEVKKLTDENAEFVKATKVTLDEKDAKIEEALTKMNRLKIEQREERAKGLKDLIYEELSGEKQTDIMQNFSSKAKEFNFEVKAVTPVVAGTVAPYFAPFQGLPHEMEHARNYIPVSPTQSDLIKYVQFTKGDGNIGTVAAGALKPNINYSSTPVEAPVRKIAGYLEVQDEFLEDVVGARDFLATELPQAYLDAEDFQIFKGTNTGQDLAGLYSIWAQALTLPKGTVTAASNRWDKIAAALTQIRRNLRVGSAIWISPEDYMELLINKGTEMMYTYPIIADANGRLSIGGTPIIQHTVFTAGQGLAGDFARGTRIFQRMAWNIRYSDSHASNFTSNITTILIEGRIALPVYFPSSFVKIDFTITT